MTDQTTTGIAGAQVPTKATTPASHSSFRVLAITLASIVVAVAIAAAVFAPRGPESSATSDPIDSGHQIWLSHHR